MNSITNNEGALKKRIDRFFQTAPENRRSLKGFITKLEEAAEVYVFGGLIREFTLQTTREFTSDVDIVVNVKDRDLFSKLLSHSDHTKNKFDGYRIQSCRWLIDLWEVQNTWAFTEGIVEFDDETSLLNTTFFNWDAAFYHLNGKRLYCADDYLSNMQLNILDVNLLQNPNELGAFVRSLRLICKNKPKTTKVLTEFLLDNLGSHSDEHILEYERNHFSSSFLTGHLLYEIRKNSFLWDYQPHFCWISDRQLDLFRSA